MNKKLLKIFCFSDGDELWADYSLEEAKNNFKKFCGVDDESVNDGYELESKAYDVLTVEFTEDDGIHKVGETITYRKFLEEFSEPNYFACDSSLC